MKFFQQLGLLVEERWKARNYDERTFHEIAFQALQELPPVKHVAYEQVIEWAFCTPDLPEQKSIDFGQPPITLYRTSRFYIEALFWMEATTSIHQHAFSGAFQLCFSVEEGGGQDLVTDLVDRKAGHLNVQSGLRVKRPPLIEELPHLVARGKQRPGPIVTATGKQQIQRSVQPDARAGGMDNLLVFRAAKRAAAEGYHGLGCGTGPHQLFPFNPAEIAFALAAEQLPDGFPFALLDPVIQVHEAPPQQLGQTPPNSRLAGSHESHQIDNHERELVFCRCL
jgi:hypothetical protein